MNLFDLIVLAVLVLLTLRGGMKGMVSQIVSVGSYFVCWIVASRFAFLVAPSIPAQEPWNRIGAMFLLFVGTMIAIRFLHRRLEKKLETLHIKEFDRQMGALFGFLKGLLVCMVITFFAVMLTEKSRQSVFQSFSGKYITFLITKTGAFIPDDTCKLLKAQIALFNAEINESAPKATEAASPTSVTGFFARGTALVDEAQQLRDDLNQKSNNAASLLDAIGKWWKGDSTKSTTDTQTEKKSEPEKTPEPPIIAKQAPSLSALSTMPPPVMESAKLTAPSLTAEQPLVLPKPPVLTSDERLIRNLVASETANQNPFDGHNRVMDSSVTPSPIPLSSPRNRFLRRLVAERPPERLLSTVKEAPAAPTAALLFSPQLRQSSTNWDPKTWAQSLETTRAY